MKSFLKNIIQKFRHEFSSIAYWEDRYRSGGNSGNGSYNKLAQFKADFINQFITTQRIQTTIEFGCGDGHQLSLIQYPAYIGMDVSQTSIALCRKRFAGDPSKQFFVYDPFSFGPGTDITPAQLSLSLDVIYHLVEDDLYELHMQHLFQFSLHYVIIYSTNLAGDRLNHERNRKFTDWVDRCQPNWKLVDTIDNPYRNDPDPESRSLAEFFVYLKM